MDNRIDIDKLLALLGGMTELVSRQPEFCLFPLRGTPWELRIRPVGRLSRQSHRLIGAHLQVIEAQVHQALSLPYLIQESSCFLYIQLRGTVHVEDPQGMELFDSDCPSISLCYYPKGDYRIRFSAGLHSMFIVSFEEDWPFHQHPNYPAFTPMTQVWQEGADRHCHLPAMPLSRIILNLLEEIRCIAVNWNQDSVRILHFLGKIIYAYHEQLEAHQATVLQSNAQLHQALDSYLEKYYMDEQRCSVQQLKKALCLSSHAARKLCRESLGCTLQRYVIEFRINKACVLLRETNEKIREIAYQTGFKDLSHFTNSFRQSMGMHPSAYRKGNS